MLMAPRIDYTKVGSGALRAMYGLEKYLTESSIEKPLRASQINGCAYCIDMHWKDARAAVVTPSTSTELSATVPTTIRSREE
jgi:AhpD family alkylhydroperoxidase